MTFYDSSATNGYIPGKDLHVDSVLSEWEPRFCDFIDVRLLVTTFNVNGKSPPPSPGALQPWFARNGNKPDFVVVGLQEMDLAIGTYVKDNNIKQFEWLSAISSCLRGYSEVHSIKLVGIFLVVYQRIDGAIPCGEIMSNHVPTGFLKFGNKGGVSIRMKINDTSICFINSHLAAGNELERRNQDYREISQLTFADNSSIYEHDLIIWLGDLNYRLATPPSIPNELIRLKCSTGDFKCLLDYDQLLQQQIYRNAFHDFQEPKINFKPTYKYDTGTNNWDSSEKRRAPAWCDRILWRVISEGTNVVASDYESIECITLSDHKPVRSLLHVTTKKIDVEKRRRLVDEANREADRRINSLRPKIRLSHTQLDFGDVWYMEPKVKTLTVENVGAGPVHFKFVARPGNDDISPDWLSVTPPSGTVMKGCAVHLSLQVLIDQRIAWEIGKPGHDGRLSDILVVRLRDGGDSFVEVFANYKKSCFGASFLAFMNTPAPEDKKEELLIDLGEPSGLESVSTTSTKVPLPLWKIVECLRANGLENIQMNDPPPDSGFVAIRNALDRGSPEQLLLMTGSGEVDLITVYTALLRLIDSFSDPIIPRDAANYCLRQVESPSYCSACVQRFPEENRIVFDYLIDFLVDLLPSHRSSQGTVAMNWLSEASKKVSAMMYIPPEDEAPEDEKGTKTEAGEAEEEQTTSITIPPSVSDFFNKAKENGSVWGRSFASYAKKATKSATETASKLKDIVQEQTRQSFLGEFDREQSDFMKQLDENETKSSDCAMPWDDVPERAIAKKQIMALSFDSRNFLRAPPSDTKFDLEAYRKTAAALLQNDPNLNKIRYQLVPKELTEEQFWTNYFYRCSLIRKSLSGEGSGNEERKETQQSSDAEVAQTSGEEIKKNQSDGMEAAATESPASSEDSDRQEKIRALKEKMDEWKSDDWEQELASEIAEFELVKGETGKDENWEKEIEDMINEELDDGK